MANPISNLISTRDAPQEARSYIEARGKACGLWKQADSETRAGAIESLQCKTGITHYNLLDQALHAAKPEFQATMDAGQHLQARQEAFGTLIKLLLAAGVILLAAGVVGAASHSLDPTKLGGAVAAVQTVPLWVPIAVAGVAGLAFAGALATAKQRSSEKLLLQEIDGHPYPSTFTKASVHLWLTGEALPKKAPPAPNERRGFPPSSQPINIPC